ncbi:MAG: LysM peptidoglycan-binding domain-containing protein [Proteobacteria bacterium]|nr:LysM peptidoglycan-binding domain-containing protein [Pseudomonadota bacterium]
MTLSVRFNGYIPISYAMKTIVDKIVIVIILALVFSSLSPPIHAKEVTGCKLYYVVKQGDTLAKIASAMGMAPMQRAALKIAKTNDIDNKNIIEVGDKLCVDENIIKTGSQALECYKISSKKKICMDKDSLKTVLASKKDIEIGNTKKCKSFHAIKKGESLSIIAKRLEMSPPYESALKLAQISGIKDPARVEIGDKVCVDKKYLKVADTSSNAKGFTCFKTKNNRKFCIEKNAIRAIKSGTEAEVVPDIEKTKPQVMPVQMEKAQTPQPDLQHQDNAEELMKKIEKQMEPEPSKQLTTEPANSKTESEIKSESKPKLETQEAKENLSNQLRPSFRAAWWKYVQLWRGYRS